MSFCEHCEGQRFDRARVLRALRQLRKELPQNDALDLALQIVRDLDLPHLEPLDSGGEIIH